MQFFVTPASAADRSTANVLRKPPEYDEADDAGADGAAAGEEEDREARLGGSAYAAGFGSMSNATNAAVQYLLQVRS